jgi:putative transposase
MGDSDKAGNLRRPSKCMIGAVLFEQNDEWQTSGRYMMVVAFAQIDKEEIDPILSITTKAA